MKAANARAHSTWQAPDFSDNTTKAGLASRQARVRLRKLAPDNGATGRHGSGRPALVCRPGAPDRVSRRAGSRPWAPGGAPRTDPGAMPTNWAPACF